MNATPLLEAMARKSAEERANILEAARVESGRIRDTAKAESAERRNRALAALEAELALASAQAQQRAEAEAQMILLTIKDTLADELLSEVQAALSRIAEAPEFAGLLPALLDELLAGGEGGTVVLVPSAHEESCRNWLAEHGHGELEVRPSRAMRDGVAIQDAQPTFRVTNTLSARFAKQSSQLRKRCIAELFPDASAAGGQGDV